MPFTLPLDPSVIVLIGKPRSGKSYAVKSMLYQYAKHKHFKFGLAVCGTTFTGAYSYLPDLYVWDSYDEDKLKAYLDSLKELRKKDKLHNNFLLIDDMMGQLNTRDSLIVNLIANHRHYKMTIFITSQYLVGNCSTLLRECSTHAFIWPLKAKNSVEATYEAFGFALNKLPCFVPSFGVAKTSSVAKTTLNPLGDFQQSGKSGNKSNNLKQWQEMLEKATSEEHACLLFVDGQKTLKDSFLSFKALPVPDDIKFKY